MTPAIDIDPSSAVPPFEQLRTQVAAQVASGELPAGARLATVRQLAADLGLAPNTVARAYRELEADGVVATYGRKGTFVRSEVVDASPDASSGRDARDRARSAAEAYVASVRALGLDVAEATRLVELAWAHG